MGYYNNSLFIFEEGRFNYLTMSSEDLSKMLEKEVFMMASFGCDIEIIKRANAFVELDVIETLIRLFESSINPEFKGLNILVHDSGAMQSINGSSAKKGAACKYIRDIFTKAIRDNKISITFVSEREDIIAKRYFSI